MKTTSPFLTWTGFKTSVRVSFSILFANYKGELIELVKGAKKISDLMENDDIFFDAEIRIGPFKLLNQIGKGKFATVSLGIHEETKEKVAIKQIKNQN